MNIQQPTKSGCGSAALPQLVLPGLVHADWVDVSSASVPRNSITFTLVSAVSLVSFCYPASCPLQNQQFAILEVREALGKEHGDMAKARCNPPSESPVQVQVQVQVPRGWAGVGVCVPLGSVVFSGYGRGSGCTLLPTLSALAI